MHLSRWNSLPTFAPRLVSLLELYIPIRITIQNRRFKICKCRAVVLEEAPRSMQPARRVAYYYFFIRLCCAANFFFFQLIKRSQIWFHYIILNLVCHFNDVKNKRSKYILLYKISIYFSRFFLFTFNSSIINNYCCSHIIRFLFSRNM